MKTRYTIAALCSVLTLGFASCQNELASPEPTPATNRFKACAPETKITLQNDYSLTWDVDDEVSVFDGTTTAIFKAESAGAATTLANPDVSIDPEKTYTAAYPAGSIDSFSEDRVILNIPEVQNLTVSPFGYSFGVAMTSGTERQFVFKNVASLIAFEITEEDIVNVTLTGGDGEDLAGQITASCETAEYEIRAGVKSVSITSESAITPGYCYFAVLPQLFSKGITMTITKQDGTNTVRHTNAFNLERSSYVDFKAVDESREWGFNISNAADLQAFLDNAPMAAMDDVYTLVNDIDLTGVTLVPATYFEGTLDGNGFSINNWIASAPLIEELGESGTVENLTIGKSCEYLVDVTTPLETYLVGNNQGLVDHCTNYGTVKTPSGIGSFTTSKCIAGLVAFNNNGRVTNCENAGRIAIYSKAFANTFDKTNKKVTKDLSQWIGGVVGKTWSDDATEASVSDCNNSNEVIFHGVRVKAGVCVGGVIGGTLAETATTMYKTTGLEDYGIIQNCVNSAKVRIEIDGMNNSNADANNAHNLGGVIGYLQGTLVNCRNVGNVVEYVTNAFPYNPDTHVIGRLAMGGVAGYVMKSVTNCHNSATINAYGYFGASDKDFFYTGTGPFRNESVFGGVVGYAGKNDGSSIISGCSNEGTLKLEMSQYATATGTVCIGGITAIAKAAVSECSNTGTMDITSNIYVHNIGGITGLSSYSISKCSNAGAITFDNGTADTSSSTDKRTWESFVGGIGGKHLAAEYTDSISECNNTGAITFKGGVGVRASNSDKARIYYIGGIAGLSIGIINGQKDNPSVNSGDIAILGGIRPYAGGICGQCAASILYADNTADITANGISNGGIENGSMVGGVVGVISDTFSVKLDNDSKATNHGQGKNNGIELIASNSGDVTGIELGATESGFGLLAGKINSNTGEAGSYWSGSTLSGDLSVTGSKQGKVGFISGGGLGCVKVFCGKESAPCTVENISLNGTPVTTIEDFAAHLGSGISEEKYDLTNTNIQ